MGGRIQNIQALRFFSAFMVAGFHTAGHYEASGGTWLFDFFAYGWAGVDVFFVISGFIMWHTTIGKSGRHEASRFAYKRAVRVYSGFLPWFFALLAIYGVFAPQWLDRFDLLKSALLFPQAHSTNLFKISWTLSFELLFYAGFAVLLLLPRRRQFFGLLCVAAVLLVAIATSATTTFLLSPLILEFIAGALLAAVIPMLPMRYGVAALALAAVLFLLGAVVSTPGDRVLRVATMGSASVVLLYAFLAFERKEGTPNRVRTLVSRLGDASYALYLCHSPVLVVVRWTIRDDLAIAPEIGYTVILAGMVALSMFWYRHYERPIYDMLTRRRIKGTSAAVGVH